MTAFILLAVAMTAAAAALLAWPMWRAMRGAPDRDTRKRLAALDKARNEGVLDEAEYRAKRQRIQAEAPAPEATRASLPVAGIVFVLLLPLGAWLIYRDVGTPQALDPLVLEHGLASPQGAAPPDMESAVRALAARMAAEPDHLDGWLLLARSYRTMERFADARDALAQARRLLPDDVDLMVEHAESMALASATRRIDGEALALLERAVQRAPAHQRALWLLGISRVQQGDNEGAIDYWQRVLALLPPDSDIALQIQEQIAEARGSAFGAAGMESAPQVSTTPPAPIADESGPMLTIEVELDAELAGSVGASDALFVFARPVGGARAPLAIKRMAAGVLPIMLTLGIEDAMMPAMTLATFPEVEVGARISRSGTATPQSGDLEAIVGPVPSNTREPIRLVIDRVVP
ncbi:MAG TPA: c-type cytochrome biogenesis protein CcmI [Xanthomonadaceae bacterium]|nr:c-type cytochrome biogenesis protein CcmI [Xanthomonadaceae bacterium]